MPTYKIIIAGIGGVGGYFGGLLAQAYEKSNAVEIFFVARGEHLKRIRDHGLHVIASSGEFIAHPQLATDHPHEIGLVDCIFICVKSYDLEPMVRSLITCIDERTVIIPLLNGVDSMHRIRSILPTVTIWPGFAYVVARINEPGIVENAGNIQKLFFGSDKDCTAHMIEIEAILKKAGIDATCTNKISILMWEKFIFISSLASLTSYLDKNRGEIMDNQDDMNMLIGLIDEIASIAEASGVNIPADIRTTTLAKLRSLTRDTTSSMHHDFKHHHKTELETLTGYVVREGQRLAIPTPIYEQIYEALNQIVR
jgi:2-dehydropantoate 2-reductase